jgi:hypothetical protein
MAELQNEANFGSAVKSGGLLATLRQEILRDAEDAPPSEFSHLPAQLCTTANLKTKPADETVKQCRVVSNGGQNEKRSQSP